ncbi:putative sporulation protein YtxC [Calidifontibacillus oryziterrae]|uniref:putative sporulation protein YtxC n=1 Tax=Calidifontibacillus oryziterrae TaxID=1191699 RepID=UPI0002DAFADB|nr:putative sporulation protein YtxC [Calidifontibacillus oryziterrae]
MVTIQFREKKDAILFFHQLQEFDHPNINDIQVHIIYEPEVLVKIDFRKSIKSLISSILIPVLIQYIIKIVEVNWMKEMIRNMFYFTDEEEQRQIMSIARSIIDGERQDVPAVIGVNKELTRNQMIESSLKDFLTSSVSFSFESFLQFRLKEYRYRLLKYIEAAIDEYKLEQEYQNFIENLRTYLYNKEPLMDTIHLVYDGTFCFFDKNKNELCSEQLTHIIDEQLLKIEDIDVDSEVLAPLISIAPRKVFIYTDHLDHGFIQTIQNVFLERVAILAKQAFLHPKRTISKSN